VAVASDFANIQPKVRNFEMIAVIKTGARQFRVTENQVVAVDKLNAAKGDMVTFDNVLFVDDGNSRHVGAPKIQGAKVTATVLREGRGPRLVVYKMKPKKNYRNKATHKQTYTTVKIDSISLG
jgi:large subunit ribosomal protein L21